MSARRYLIPCLFYLCASTRLFFAGYEGVPDFFTHVTQLLKDTVDQPNAPAASTTSTVAATASAGSNNSRASEEDSGIDTGDSSDEKRHQNQPGARPKRASLQLNSVGQTWATDRPLPLSPSPIPPYFSTTLYSPNPSLSLFTRQDTHPLSLPLSPLRSMTMQEYHLKPYIYIHTAPIFIVYPIVFSFC